MNPPGSPVPVPALPVLSAHATSSSFVTAFTWCVVAASAIGCIVSLLSLLALAGRNGTANATLLGGFMVIGVPPLTLIAGIGLLCRWRLAYGYMLVLLGCLAIWNIARILRGSTPEHTYVAPSGVPTTVLATKISYPTHFLIIAASLGLCAKLLTSSVRAEFWRTRQAPVRASAVGAPSIPAPPPVVANHVASRRL